MSVPRRRVFAVATLMVLLTGCRHESDSPARVQVQMRVLTVAAASDLKFALDAIVASFRRGHPEVAVKVVYGSSGQLFAQLGNRGPFDVFLSADAEYPRRLVAMGLARGETLFPYAVGRIVVWVPNHSVLALDRLGIEAVVDPSVRKLAIANPKHAPYGRAAEAALKALGVYERVRNRLVLGENVAQTAHFVAAGGADVGILSLSLANSPALRDKGRSWPIPTDAYPTIEQVGVILDWAKDLDLAKLFRSFVTGSEGRAVLREHGFGLEKGLTTETLQSQTLKEGNTKIFTTETTEITERNREEK
jgi:molybdate transport system substrate-binding protein